MRRPSRRTVLAGLAGLATTGSGCTAFTGPSATGTQSPTRRRTDGSDDPRPALTFGAAVRSGLAGEGPVSISLSIENGHEEVLTLRPADRAGVPLEFLPRLVGDEGDLVPMPEGRKHVFLWDDTTVDEETDGCWRFPDANRIVEDRRFETDLRPGSTYSATHDVYNESTGACYADGSYYATCGVSTPATNEDEWTVPLLVTLTIATPDVTIAIDRIAG